MRLGQIARFLDVQLDDAGADVGAADVDGEDAVVAGEDPGRRQMDRADQAGLVGMVADRPQLDVVAVLALEQHGGAADRELADAAGAQAAADRDPLACRASPSGAGSGG